MGAIVFETTEGAQDKVDLALASIEPRIAGSYDFASTLGPYPASGIVGLTTTLTMTSGNNAVGVRWRPARDMLISKLIWFSGGVRSGNYDLAILGSAGVRLWSLGATAYPAINTATPVVVSPGLAVTAGVEYDITLAIDNATATYRGLLLAFPAQAEFIDGTPWCRVKSSAYPIPDPSVMVTAATRIPLIIVRED